MGDPFFKKNPTPFSVFLFSFINQALFGASCGNCAGMFSQGFAAQRRRTPSPLLTLHHTKLLSVPRHNLHENLACRRRHALIRLARAILHRGNVAPQNSPLLFSLTNSRLLEAVPEPIRGIKSPFISMRSIHAYELSLWVRQNRFLV